MFGLLKKFRARDINAAFDDKELNLRQRMADMAAEGIPWETIITLVIQIIQAWLANRGQAVNTQAEENERNGIGKTATKDAQPPTAEVLAQRDKEEKEAKEQKEKGGQREVPTLEDGKIFSQEQHDPDSDTAVPENKAAYDGQKPDEDPSSIRYKDPNVKKNSDLQE